ncbi:MAG TPA: universal stress protein [Pyrinomonadaceae bacterium]|nr:universal stress protein [Pyrinomonadaceae bacterium]
MKILIGYDGSECAQGVFRDLRRAGLPQEGEALVISVADVFQPPPIKEVDQIFPMYVPAGVRRAHEHAARAVAQARDLAEEGQAQIAKLFPGWHVRAEACADSPAWALIRRAEEWQADLILVGSQGLASIGGRLILGSVSQRVLYEARTSVRVARGRVSVDDLPVRIVIGMDGSLHSRAALDAVASRVWPRGSEARLVIVLDTILFLTPGPSEAPFVKWFEVENANDLKSLEQFFEGEAEKLRQAGLSASVVLKKGNPKYTLIEEAENWKAESVFLGAKGARGIDRLLLGSVSATVAARAHCSVEVIRGRSEAHNNGS